MPAPVRPPTLFRRLLGRAYESLPGPIQAVHDQPANWRGHCTVERGPGIAARGLGWLMALPPPGRHAAIEVHIEPHPRGETWTRAIGGKLMCSHLREEGGLLVESMGPATFRFVLERHASHVGWRLHSVCALGMPLPRRLFAIDAKESVEDGLYRFEVRAAIIGIGLLVAYDGRLVERIA